MIEILILAFLLWPKKGIAGTIKAKTRFQPVYIDGKPNPGLIRASIKRPGVYLIKVNGSLKYIGHSGSNVYKTILRHFQSWEDRFQVRITYPKASYVTARIVYTNTAQQARKLEKALILKLKPPDNPKKYENYQLDFKDEEIVSDYQNSDIEAPF